MCTKFSVACLLMIATFKNEALSSHLANPYHISVLRVWKKSSGETIVSSSILQVTSLAAVTQGRIQRLKNRGDTYRMGIGAVCVGHSCLCAH